MSSSKSKSKSSSKPKEPEPPSELIVIASESENGSKIYLHLETLRALGLAAGAFVELSSSSCKVLAIATPQSCDPDTVEVPKSLRDVGSLLLGDRVKVNKAQRPASAELVRVYTKNPLSKVEKILENCPLLKVGLLVEDCVIVQFDGGELFTDKTTVEILDENPLPLTQTGYAAIGGLEQELKLLRSKIELPLNHPDLFQRFNTAPERGFLLYGPPGTGKTMLLRAIANETAVHIVRVNGPSLYSKYLGETESALRSVFEEAQRFAPSIIFFDEIDSVAPKRDSDEAGETESRVVSTLLTLMDGMQAGGRIVVVGATNRPNILDPALRRPGRFGQEIEIGIPNAEGRKAILELKLAGMPNKLSSSEVGDIAAKTHGYVGADLQALCRDAVMNAIESGLVVNTPKDELFVTKKNFDQALVSVRPSAMREIFIETPKIYWSDIGGQNRVIQQLKETVEWPLKYKSSFERLGITPPRGVLLYGPPGCSKTLLVKTLATETGLNFLAVKGPEVFNKYVGESERAIREVFRKARATAPSIIFFDEIDALSISRGDDGGGAGGDRVLTSLLNEMDGIEVLKDVIIIAATNRPDVIDSALMRPGRLDRLLYVTPPDLEARRQILLIQFSKMSIDDSVDLDELAAATEGCSGAEVVSLCQEAGLVALNEDVSIECIKQEHFMTVLKTLRRNITPAMLEYFENFDKGLS